MTDDRQQALDELEECVLWGIVTKRAIDDKAPAAIEMRDAVELAALRLVNIVCELPDRERPEGWEPDPSARTA